MRGSPSRNVRRNIDIDSQPNGAWSQVIQVGIALFLIFSLGLAPIYCLPYRLKMQSLPAVLLPALIWLQMLNTGYRHLRKQNTRAGAMVEQSVLLAMFFSFLHVSDTIAHQSNAVVDFVRAHVAELVLGLSAAMLIGYCRRWINNIVQRSQTLVSDHYGLEIKGDIKRLTAQDRLVIATHEAGHAIVLGLYRTIPANLEIVMLNRLSATGSLGHCTGPAWMHSLGNKAYAEWEMLFCLAGIEAERLVLGEISLGGTSDYKSWNDAAQTYLRAHDELIFFSSPDSSWKEDHNCKTLLELRKNQQAIVRELLLENEHILLLLRDELIHKRRVSGDNLVAILNKVAAVEGCPASLTFKKTEQS